MELAQKLRCQQPAGRVARRSGAAPRRWPVGLLGLLSWLASSCAAPSAPAPGAAGPVFAPDSSYVRVAANPTYARRGWWWQRLWGPHYRALWATPVVAPTLRLRAAGLVPVRVGGSFQTNVLRLRAPDSRWWVLRSVDKDLSRQRARNWLEDLAAPVLRDQTCAAPPYGAAVAAALARAAGIRHPRPQLVYLLPDASLGALRPRFRAALYWLEERPESNPPGALPDATRRVVSSALMLRTVLAGAAARPDARLYLRARLLDLLVGDWSRRADQWRWEAVPEGARVVYRPLPRDRDQAFFRFDDGWLTRVVSWLRPRYQTFGRQLPLAAVRPLTVTARALDNTLLAGLPETAFLAEADSLTRRLPPRVLRQALAAVPAAARPLLARELEAALLARRAALPAAARRYYQVLQQEPVVTGTDAAERFELQAAGPGGLRLRVWARRPLHPDRLLYETRYHVSRTTRLTIYGLGGNDMFELRGRLAPGFGVHLHGGAGRNQFLQEILMQPNGPGLTVYATPADLLQLSSSVRVLPGAAEAATPAWIAARYRLGAGKR